MRLGKASALLLCAAGAVAAQDAPVDVRAVVTRQLRFSSSDFADLRRGLVVKHDLPARAPGEISVAGAVRIRATPAAFFARVRDIVRFKGGPDVLEIARFSNPPTLDDLAALTVDKDDFDVRACRLGDCGIRLPANVIGRFAREVDLSAPDAQARGATRG